jgi:pyruvate/2-oxoglutarate dehydrogenase complex dihydrolipoamide dehydrogenase (E3) component
MLEGSHLLVATGRRPNTEELHLESAGLETDAGGYIPVNDRLETAAPGIWALGDVKGGPAFTHISYDDYRIVRKNVLEGGNASVHDRLVPYTVFTDPQLGRVGLSEKAAREKGLDFRVKKLPMDYVARALETDESRGFMKALVETGSGRILGAAVLGVNGGELAALIEVAMLGGLTADELYDAVLAHPTLAESLNNLFAPD